MRVKANLYFVFTRKVKETQILGKHKFVARGKNDIYRESENENERDTIVSYDLFMKQLPIPFDSIQLYLLRHVAKKAILNFRNLIPDLKIEALDYLLWLFISPVHRIGFPENLDLDGVHVEPNLLLYYPIYIYIYIK